jgi:Tfp pilus assembly protein FimT
LELLVIMGIVAVLSMIAFPFLTDYLADSRARTEARSVDSAFQRARMMAAITQRPVRVVLNCTRAVAPACVLNLQTALYSGVLVSGWNNEITYRREMHEKVEVEAATGPGTSHDGSATTPGIHWAIFMPDSRVFSDPRPLSLFFHQDNRTGPATRGWRVSLSSDSGRVQTQRDQVDL